MFWFWFWFINLICFCLLEHPILWLLAICLLIVALSFITTAPAQPRQLWQVSSIKQASKQNHRMMSCTRSISCSLNFGVLSLGHHHSIACTFAYFLFFWFLLISFDSSLKYLQTSTFFWFFLLHLCIPLRSPQFTDSPTRVPLSGSCLLVSFSYCFSHPPLIISLPARASLLCTACHYIIGFYSSIFLILFTYFLFILSWFSQHCFASPYSPGSAWLSHPSSYPIVSLLLFLLSSTRLITSFPTFTTCLPHSICRFLLSIPDYFLCFLFFCYLLESFIYSRHPLSHKS